MDYTQYRYDGKKAFKIKDWATTPPKSFQTKKKAIEKTIAEDIAKMAESQAMLYAQNEYSLLLLFQGMDAAGKDGMISHVMRGVNPEGTTVTSFKQPSALELDHEYLWRTRLAFPEAGGISVFNRSHYEEVLVDRVHPENVLKEHIPGIRKVGDITDDFWDQRYADFRGLEDYAARNGIVIMKFFLHLSKEEQKKRFLARIEVPEKNWKFSATDISERRYWDDYQKAYQKAIANTATKTNPWYVIPADDKWFARLTVSKLINARLDKLPLAFPEVSAEQKAALQAAWHELDEKA